MNLIRWIIVAVIVVIIIGCFLQQGSLADDDE